VTLFATDAPTLGGGDGFDDLDEAWLRARPGVKWRAVGPDVLPCWVADMDYPAPRPVRAALARLAAGGDLGYKSDGGPALLQEKWASRMLARHGWAPAPGRLRAFTDLIQIVEVVLHLTTAPGDGVLLFTPAYPPFVQTIEKTGRRLLTVPAIDDGARWSFDMGAAAARAAEAKVLVLVNPHNPTGRVLDHQELMAVGDLAQHHGLIVISDEVHSDLVLAGTAVHVPLASLSDDLAARTITLYSASKSYNLGGMACGVAHVGHAGVERQLAALPPHLLGVVGVAALTTTLASWSAEGDAWLERCLVRLRDNRKIVGRWLTADGAGAGVRGYPPEATYLSWLDFRPARLGDDPAAWLLEQAKVKLSPGPTFGPGGAGFARLNFATSPGLLREILDRIADALSNRTGPRDGRARGGGPPGGRRSQPA
jgi:cystathionine beta-lyase